MVIAEIYFQAIYRNGEARFVALDISKAFNRVLHTGSLPDVKGYGISERILDLIQSFMPSHER